MNKENRSNLFGTTDYNIPVFSIRSAALIVGTTMLLTIAASYLFNGSQRIINLVIALSLGLTTAVSRYLIDTKRGLQKGFWITFAVIFAASYAVLLFLK